MADGKKIIAENRKARFNYFIEDSIECGIELRGSEVKSIKSGNLSFPDGFADIKGGDVWVQNLHISEYSYSSAFTPSPDRPKRLLLHKDEIKRLARKTEEKGYTLVPLEFYLKGGRVKVKLGVCKGKKQYDKRDAIRSRDMDREAAREFRREING